MRYFHKSVQGLLNSHSIKISSFLLDSSGFVSYWILAYVFSGLISCPLVNKTSFPHHPTTDAQTEAMFFLSSPLCSSAVTYMKSMRPRLIKCEVLMEHSEMGTHGYADRNTPHTEEKLNHYLIKYTLLNLQEGLKNK